MRTHEKPWKNCLYILVLIIAIILLFRWYSVSNSNRIEEQNLNYAMDSARLTSTRINSEFNNALLRLRNYAYLIGSNRSQPAITAT